MSDNKRYIQSITRAAAVLECFSHRKPYWKLTEIAHQLGLGKSTVHGIVDTLQHLGMLDQDPDSLLYSLGTRMIHYGSLAEASLDIIAIARRHMEQLCSQVQETIHLGLLQELNIVYIDKVETSRSMRISTTRGSVNPAYCTGVGKALLAYAGEAVHQRLFDSPRPKLTQTTMTDSGQLQEEFERIRRQGYATDWDENEIGLSCIAMPIHEHNGEVRYAMSISGPSVRMTQERMPELMAALRQTVNQVERQLGYTDTIL